MEDERSNQIILELLRRVSSDVHSPNQHDWLNMLENLQLLNRESKEDQSPLKRHKLFMENHLDLNENEIDYYEQLVEDLVTKLETVNQEKDKYENISNVRERECEEMRSKLLECEVQLKQSRDSIGDAHDIYDLLVCIFEYFNYFSDEQIQNLRSGEKKMTLLRTNLLKFLESARASGLNQHGRYEQAELGKIDAQAKQLHLLQDLNHELKVKLEVVQRDNDLLQQEVSLLKRIHDSASKESEQETMLSWMSDELKILDLTSHLKDLSKQNGSLSQEVERLESSLALRTKAFEESMKEIETLRGNLRKMHSELENLRMRSARHESSDKLRQLDIDEGIEDLKQKVRALEVEIADSKQLVLEKNAELAEERAKSSYFKEIIEKMAEREDMSDNLIAELRKLQREAFGTEVHDDITMRFGELLQNFTTWEDIISKKFQSLFRRVDNCMSQLRIIDGRSESHFKNGSFMKPELSDTLNKFDAIKLVKSDKRLEMVSSEYAKNYAQNSKVFAFMESECSRLKSLCDHLRGTNAKITAELRRAIIFENKSKTLEQKVKTLSQVERSLSEKCSRLESTLKKKNEELLALLRSRDEKESLLLEEVQKQLDSTILRLTQTQNEKKLLEDNKYELERLLDETRIILSNERKISSNRIEATENELSIAKRFLSQKDLELGNYSNRLEEVQLQLKEQQLSSSLLIDELKVQGASLQRKVSDLDSELEEKNKQLDSVTVESSRIKVKLLEAESKLLFSNEEISKYLSKISAKDDTISSLHKELEAKSQQLLILTEQQQCLQSNLEAKTIEYTEIVRHVESLTSSVQEHLRVKIQLENDLRLISDVSVVTKEQLVGKDREIASLHIRCDEKDDKIRQLQEHILSLEEKLEYQSTINISLLSARDELNLEVTQWEAQYKELESDYQVLKTAKQYLEENLFSLELKCKQAEDEVVFSKSKVVSLESNELAVFRQLQKLKAIALLLATDIWTNAETSANFDEESSSEKVHCDHYSIAAELDQMKHFLLSCFRNIQDLLRKQANESEEKVICHLELDRLRKTILQLEKEGLQIRSANEKLQQDLSASEQNVTDIEAERVKSMEAAVKTITYIYSSMSGLLRTIRQSIVEEAVVSSDEKLALISLQSDNPQLLQSSVDSIAEELKGLFQTVLSMRDNLRLDLNDARAAHLQQLQVLQAERDKVTNHNIQLQGDLELANSNLLKMRTKAQEMENRCQELTIQLKEQQTNYLVLEKEFKSVTDLNVELGQSLTEAETLCSEMRRSYQLAESQLNDCRSHCSQLQNQLNMIQKKCSESDTRLETVSFSLRRLKAEKEALENVKQSLEYELERMAIQPAEGLISNEAYNTFLFDLEKINSVIGAIATLLNLDVESHPGYDERPKTEGCVEALEKIRGWIKNHMKEKISLEKEVTRLQEISELHSSECSSLREQLEKVRSANINLEKELQQSRNHLEDVETRLRDKIKQLDALNLAEGSATSEISDILKEKRSLEADYRKIESELSILQNELNLKAESYNRLKQEVEQGRARENDLMEENRVRTQQLETANANAAALLTSYQQLEERVSQHQSTIASLEQQLSEHKTDERQISNLKARIEELREEIELLRKENDLLKTDNANFGEVNLVLKKELEVTRTKTISLEEHVAVVQQEKSVFLDEINETRRKIQIAKDSFELEKVQRIRSEAAAAALLKAQEERRRHEGKLPFHSSSADHMESTELSSLKQENKRLKLELEERNSSFTHLQQEKKDMEAVIVKLHSQLAEKNADLRSNLVETSKLKLEMSSLEHRTADVRKVLQEIYQLISEDIADVDAKSESLQEMEIYSVALSLRSHYFTLRTFVETVQQRVSVNDNSSLEVTKLREAVNRLRSEHSTAEEKFRADVQVLQSQLSHYRNIDVQHSALLQRISSLESSLQIEREQKEKFLSELMTMISKSNQGPSSEGFQDVKVNSSEITRLRSELSQLQVSFEDLKKENEALNHHRTVLKAVIEDLEIQIKGADEAHVAAVESRLVTEEDVNWEITRLKRKVHNLTELCRLYYSGLTTLSDRMGSSLPYQVEKDFDFRKCYDEEINLLDSRLESLQLKLRQYRKYGLEVRKQFEEMLKSIHRIGKQPAMDIAIRQIEHLRTQLEETQDYIGSLQDEANQDRKFYRDRFNCLIMQVEKFRRNAKSALDRLKYSDREQGAALIKEVLMELTNMLEHGLESKPTTDLITSFHTQEPPHTALISNESQSSYRSLGKATLRVSQSKKTQK